MLWTSAGTENGNKHNFLCDGGRGYTEGGRKSRKDKPPGGVCVYYGSETKIWEENIDLLKQFKTALAIVDDANNKTATIQRDIDKLQTLLHRAEEIYETTQVISEIQKPVVPTNLQTAAKRLTTYNAARRYHPCHFILTWVPLLL
ncbi:hypothetical protein, unlikely [Trypanosoma congolense IL3000]|uniref:Uncharacterized protein n=1 Tax=Trypanosoma congolense (strain IL3000) TaxID=1068625 RepID=F9WGD9_TRYCI|nr:hypothetical protein, unlikely [Trypanosoma congolense IL3000]